MRLDGCLIKAKNLKKSLSYWKIYQHEGMNVNLLLDLYYLWCNWAIGTANSASIRQISKNHPVVDYCPPFLAQVELGERGLLVPLEVLPGYGVVAGLGVVVSVTCSQ